MVDMHLRLALQHFLHTNNPSPAHRWRCERKDSWCAFFADVNRLYWFHDYVMSLVDNENQMAGYSLSNVEMASYELNTQKNETQTSEQLAIVLAKQSLVALLKKAYKYRFE